MPILGIILAIVGLLGAVAALKFILAGGGASVGPMIGTAVGYDLPGGVPVWAVVALVIILPWAARRFSGVFGLPGRILFAVWDRIVRTLIPAALSRRVEAITPATVTAWLDRRFANDDNPLLKGDRLAFARMAWPEAKWPTLYKDIPADVRRPVIWDGRLVGGHPVTWLGWHHVTADVVATFLRSGCRVGLRAGAIMTIAAFVGLLLGAASYHAPAPYPSWADGVAFAPKAAWFALAAADFTAHALVGLGLAVAAGLLFAPAAAFMATWRPLMLWWSRATAALRRPTRDSVVVYKHRTDIRQTEYAAYARQVEQATGRLADEPVVTVGRASGVFRARGDMEAPEAGQTVATDAEGVRKHFLVLGGTGEGKTRDTLRPLFHRLMLAFKAAGRQIGAYVTCGKGTLGYDLKDDPCLAGRTDVVIVGTKEGEHGVNLMAGMSPLEVSTTLKAVAEQVGGKSSDDFWPEMASLLSLHAATIAEALDLDPDLDDPTTDVAQAWTDCRPYSLTGMSRIATDWSQTDAAIIRLIQLDDVRMTNPVMVWGDLTEKLLSDELAASVQWFNGTWSKLGDQTKGSIIASFNQVLGKLAGAGELRRRFADGRFEKTVDVTHALDGGVFIVGVGETEWGVPGKVVNVWLKTRLFIEARKKLQREGREACAAVSCMYIADEAQMLATTGPDSDATFWNIARETGVFGVLASQSIAALEGAIGKDATANLLNLLRNKVFLKTEEVSTIEYSVKLAGETLRGYVFEDDYYETQGQRAIECPDVPVPAAVNDDLFLGRILPMRALIDTPYQDSAIRLDRRFIAGLKIMGGDNSNEVLASLERATWRQEDKEREAKGAGLENKPLLSTSEFLLGQGFAFAIIQRAGSDRMDLIDLRLDD